MEFMAGRWIPLCIDTLGDLGFPQQEWGEERREGFLDLLMSRGCWGVAYIYHSHTTAVFPERGWRPPVPMEVVEVVL